MLYISPPIFAVFRQIRFVMIVLWHKFNRSIFVLEEKLKSDFNRFQLKSDFNQLLQSALSPTPSFFKLSFLKKFNKFIQTIVC